MMNFRTTKIICSCLMLALLTACSGRREFEFKNLTEEVSAIKEDGGIYKVGNTYTALGQTYTPKEDYSYSEVGMASWYGTDFHNKRTANGERYNMHAVTAAHRTLPLPSIVRVTNLENGKSIIARVNDRGPYVKNRIIDLSEKGAELLGYKIKGTTKVKVEVLAKESRAIKEAMLSQTNSSKIYNEAIKYSTVTETAKSAPAVAPTPVAAPVAVADNNPDKESKTIADNNVQAPATEYGTFYVQVGAFSDLDKAKEMASSMKRFGTVSIYEAYLSKDGVYRVRLGAYQSRDEALKILDRVLDYGHADVTIVEG